MTTTPCYYYYPTLLSLSRYDQICYTEDYNYNMSNGWILAISKEKSNELEENKESKTKTSWK